MNKSQKYIHPILSEIRALIEAYQLLVSVGDLEQAKVKGITKKRRALYRASIVYICASWESFLEAAIEDGIEFIINESSTSSQLPQNLLIRISTRLIDTKDAREIWKISNDGWKNELKINFKLLIDKFNTARPDQVDELIYKTIGIKNISNNWKWQGQSTTASKRKLNEFMDLRGNIVHRIFHDKPITDAMISGYVNFLYRISCITSNVIHEHIFQITQKYPWENKKIENLVE